MANELMIQQLASDLQISEKQIAATLMLLEGGATIPFIARYRKEMTGLLNEVQIAAIRDNAQQWEEVEKRRTAILKSITEQEQLTPELEQKLFDAQTLTELEDIYLPYKPKRRTRATIAKEKGLEPLAKILMKQNLKDEQQLAHIVQQYINEEKQVANAEEALAGARDIIAEWVNENAIVRSKVRRLFDRKAQLGAKVVTAQKDNPEAQKYRDYFKWEEPLNRMPSHRFLAIIRASNEGFLRVNIAPDADEALELLERQFIRSQTVVADQMHLALKDSYKRLLKPSIETETRNNAKEKADREAIDVFISNLRELLLASPLGQKRVLAIDPGFRTGCKVVCLDAQGALLYYTAIFPHDRSPMKRFEAIDKIETLCEEYKIEAIAIGNGTAGRETMQFLKKMKLDDLTLVMVNESGASIYSASEIARREFPNHDITVRGAVSIGRRLMDPLAELVKIDPKSIGVGQYQHDVNQTALKKSLDDVVMSCVNAVGVEINTASQQLLTYLSGVGPKLAQNIVDYRTQNGAFQSKTDLKNVKGVGEKAFEQAAGFIRIQGATNPLDASAVHPESYGIVEEMAEDQDCTIADLVSNAELRKNIDLYDYASDSIGLPTLEDILLELAKPGRDPREQFESVEFSDQISEIDDLEEGMIINGVITNVTKFGAFVDIGLHENGLVHISHLANRFVRDPKEVVSVNQKVKVKVLSIDLDRKRIGLSMKEAE